MFQAISGMKPTNQNTNLISKIFCRIFGHKYKTTKKITQHIEEYTCKCCKRQLTTNSNGKLVDLTPKRREINALLKRMYLVKLKRLKRNTINSTVFKYLKSS